jgi:hypothetical protein
MITSRTSSGEHRGGEWRGSDAPISGYACALLKGLCVGEMVSGIIMEDEKTQNTLRLTPVADPAERAFAAVARVMPS